jgi:uncharacterized membrane protein (DUF373 family)
MVKIKVIIIVGLIAVTRKVLMMDMEVSDPHGEWATAGMIVALALSYFLISKSSLWEKNKKEE